jgi:hypothetical protein
MLANESLRILPGYCSHTDFSPTLACCQTVVKIYTSFVAEMSCIGRQMADSRDARQIKETGCAYSHSRIVVEHFQMIKVFFLQDANNFSDSLVDRLRFLKLHCKL